MEAGTVTENVIVSPTLYEGLSVIMGRVGVELDVEVEAEVEAEVELLLVLI